MEANQLPHYDMSDNPTGCCPRFNPEGWDGAELHFRDKPFVRAETKSVMHVPVNMGAVFSRVQQHIEAVGGFDPDNMIVLSRDLSAWKAEHLFSSAQPVPGEEMVTLSGDFITRVFEGPYKDAKHWYQVMKDLAAARGKADGTVWFFYTTCPKCAKTYGKNYVVGLAEI
ncbi:MAG: hydrolase [Thalassovita sp.]|nr:hydrolase [Thalassovita sp.]